MDKDLKYYIVLPWIFIWGAILIYGGKKQWKWFVDPPEYLVFGWPLVLFLGKKLFGKNNNKFVVALGWCFILIGLGVLFFA